jgi:peroxiredoxin
MSFFHTKTTQYRLMTFAFLALLISGGFFLFNSHSIQLAPDITFTTIKGEKIVLKNLRGRPVLVTFWATDCPSCVKEVTDFIQLYQQFHPQGLEIIAVAMDYDIPSHVVEMSTLKQIPYHIALDLRGEIAQAFSNVQLTPTTFLIAADGKIIFDKVGLFDVTSMQQRIAQLL